MPIHVTCACGKALRLADDKQGKRVRCPACQGVLTVGPPAAAAPGQAVAPAPRRAPGNGAAAGPRLAPAPAKSKKSKPWVFLLVGCLGLVVLGCGGTVGAVVLLVGLASSSSPEGKLAGKWVLDPDATLRMNPAFAKTYEDVRFDFHKDGTVVWAWGGSTDVPGTWKKVAGDKKGLQLQLRRGAGGTITFPVVLVDDDHIQVEHPAKCQLRREGTASTPAPPSPEREALAHKVVGKWACEEDRNRDTWEFSSDGTARFTSTRAPSWGGKYRVVGDGLLEVDRLAGATVLSTQRFQVRALPDELAITPVGFRERRFQRVTGGGPAAGAPAKAPPKAVVVRSARHNIVRSNSVRTVAVAPDGRTVAWTEWGPNEMLRVWDVSGSNVIVRLKPLPPPGEGWEGLAFSPDSRTVAAGLSDGGIRLFDVMSGGEKAALRGHTKLVGSLAFPRDRKVLVSGSWDKSIKVWDLATGKATGGLTAKGNVLLASPSADGRKVACLVAGDGTHFGDLSAGLTRATAGGRCLALSPDGGTLALGTSEGAIKLLDTQSWKPKGELKGHQGAVTCLCFSGDGKGLASGGEDKAARLWDVAGGYERATFQAHTDAVNAVGLSADGRVLASGGKDKMVYVWQAPGR